MTRLSANIRILNLLYRYMLDNPDQRFGQVLRNTRVIRTETNYDGQPIWVNEFNTESKAILARMKAKDE